jgi:hypothetical protein
VPSEFTTTDTGGCSCEQLLEMSRADANQVDFGCRGNTLVPPTCGDGFCDPVIEDQCSCASDCGSPPVTETGMCSDDFDNDCDGKTDCSDKADCGNEFLCTCEPRNAACESAVECCSGVCQANGKCD